MDAELALWQARVDEMQVAMERLRDERADLQMEIEDLRFQLDRYKDMADNFRQALAQHTPY
jgi:cell division septum initiation protein DivIVA